MRGWSSPGAPGGRSCTSSTRCRSGSSMTAGSTSTPRVRRPHWPTSRNDWRTNNDHRAAPRRLVHEWRSLYDPELAQEEPSQVTWEIEPQDGGYCKLTLVHDKLGGAPKTAASVSGAGWMFVLSGLKTLVETGEPLSAWGTRAGPPVPPPDPS